MKKHIKSDKNSDSPESKCKYKLNYFFYLVCKSTPLHFVRLFRILSLECWHNYGTRKAFIQQIRSQKWSEVEWTGPQMAETKNINQLQHSVIKDIICLKYKKAVSWMNGEVKDEIESPKNDHEWRNHVDWCWKCCMAKDRTWAFLN